MNYVRRVVDPINAQLPELEPELAHAYALLVLTKGTATTLADVHDAWGVWCTRINPEHPSLVPFDDLSHEVQALDAPYRDAIHAVARRPP